MKKNLKKLISTIAALAIAVSCVPAFAADFTDVADTADYKVAVDNIVALGIAQGNPDGTFAPENLIKRSEAAKMIVGTMGPAMMNAAAASKGETGFADVPAEHWASGFVVQGVSKGYINGMGDGTFAPDANVTYGQIVKMLVCVLGYGEDAEAAGGWVGGGYLTKAGALGVTDGFDGYLADQAVNRGEVAMLINNSLDIPVKAIVDYETGFEMDEKGNLKTVIVPVTEPMDGKKGRDYETLLTTYFDAYAVRGRITGVDKVKGVVEYKVEFSNNFEDESYKLAYNDEEKEIGTTKISKAFYPANADVDALYMAYTDAIVKVNEDDEYEIISLTSYGKNEVYTETSKLYAAAKDQKSGCVSFYKSADTKKTNDYEVNGSTQYFVNGVKQTKSEALAYVTASKTTEVKLVDTPASGSNAIDGVIDYVMVAVYTSAIVDDVFVDENEAVIYLEGVDADVLGEAAEAYIEINLDDVADGDALYAVVDTEGNEVALEEIAENDVLTIYTDVTVANPLVNPATIEIIVCKDVVSGTVKENNTAKGEYLVDDVWYAFAKSGTLEVGVAYDLYLDVFGNIVKKEQSATYANYGILNRVWKDAANGDYRVRLVNADGEIVSYVAKDKDAYTDAETLYKAAFTDDTADAFAEAYENLVVTYKVNANDKIHSIAAVTVKETNGDFSEKKVRIGAAEMCDLTKVVDYTAVNGGKVGWDEALATYVGASSIENFVAEDNYTVLYVDDKDAEINGKYTPFVIVTKGAYDINTSAAIAVVKSTGSSINDADGEKYTSAKVVENGSKEEKIIYFEDGKAGADLKKGAVIVYNVNNDGLVDDYYAIFDATDSVIFDEMPSYTYAGKYNTYIKEATAGLPSSWVADDESDEKYAEVGYGVVVNSDDTELTVGKVEKVDGKYVTKVVDEIDYASDVNVYVWDQTAGNGYELKLGAVSSIRATKIADTNITEVDGADVWNWTAAKRKAVNTVFYKTYEDEITDIIMVIPEDGKISE